MKITVDQQSFEQTGINKLGGATGTVLVNGNRQRAVLAFIGGVMQISLYGYVGRYRTSSNPWRAIVTWHAGGNVYVDFGRDDRSGRFNKQNAISYEPEVFAGLCNPRYWEPAQ